jgi:hypothetical protein
MYHSAEECWSKLEADREPVLDRSERFASLTVPKLLLPTGFQLSTTDMTNDYQSLGAQALNHVTNKLMLAMFSPARPFFKVQLGEKTVKDLEANGLDEMQLVSGLAAMERKASQQIDLLAQRPKLYQICRHLVGLGNVLAYFGKEMIRVFSLRHFCVKRNTDGSVHTLIVKEKVKYDELDTKIKEHMATIGRREADDHECSHYRLLTRTPGGDMVLAQFIDTVRLPKEFDGKWPEADCPWKVLVWDLADEADYATGLVEEYSADLETLSILAEAVVDGAIVGTEVRYGIRPASNLTADDANKSENGDFLPASPDDIGTILADNSKAITVADSVMQRYERRIGTAFLMNSAVTRDAERVTAEEIRITAQELETAYGGVYSALAPQLQKPVAEWGLARAGTDIKGADVKVMVITGLEALSRNGELDNLRLALGDLAMLTTVPPELQARLKWNNLVTYVGAGRGTPLADFVMNDEEFQAKMAHQQTQRVNEASATAAGETQAAPPQPTPQG